MARIIEGFWDCPYCDTKGIRGSVRVCPTCGKPRGEDTKFYINKPEENVVDEKKAEDAKKGPDWLCSYCDSYNPADVETCRNCGHGRDEEDKDYFEKQTEKKAKENKQRKYEAPCQPQKARKENGGRDTAEAGNIVDGHSKSLGKKLKKPLSFIVPIACVLLLIFGGIYFFVPKDTEFIVSALDWQYDQQLEEYKTLNESDWSLPVGGRLSYTQQEIHHYDEVLDHYETKTRTYTEQVFDHNETIVTGYTDNGNGYFTEQTTTQPVYRTETRTETYEEPVYISVPVYQTRYYYEIDRWVPGRTITSFGTDKNTYIGDYTLADNERVGDLNTEYEFIGMVEDEEKTIEVSEDIWNTYDVGDSIPATINRLGIVSLKISKTD